MNSRLCKYLALFAVFFCLTIVSSTVTVGKPDKPVKPPNPDPGPPSPTCETSTADFPAFIFWRETGRQNSPEITVYLASEDGACIRSLAKVPDSSRGLQWESAFSYDETTGMGRVVWSRGDPYRIADVWLQEFEVDGKDILPPPDPEVILVNPDPETMDILDIEISSDLQQLTFIHRIQHIEDSTYEVRVMDIDACIYADASCTPDSTELILRESLVFDPQNSQLWNRLAWGPIDKRIYLRQVRGKLDTYEQSAVRMITLTSGSSFMDRDRTIDDKELFTSDEYPEYAGLSDLGGSVLVGGEKLAIRHDGDCKTISVIDVKACEVGPTNSNERPCEAEGRFFGNHLSWSDQGTIIHEIVERGRLQKKSGRYICTSDSIIGEWDPIELEVTPLAEGENPDSG